MSTARRFSGALPDIRRFYESDVVIDTFNLNNNGTTMSATRLAHALVARGHTVRVVACGQPGDQPGQGSDGLEMFPVPELVMHRADPWADLGRCRQRLPPVARTRRAA